MQDDLSRFRRSGRRRGVGAQVDRPRGSAAGALLSQRGGRDVGRRTRRADRAQPVRACRSTSPSFATRASSPRARRRRPSSTASAIDKVLTAAWRCSTTSICPELGVGASTNGGKCMTDLSHLNAPPSRSRPCCAGELRAPQVKAFFDEPTFTASYVVSDPATKAGGDHRQRARTSTSASGRTSFESADAIIAYVEAEGLDGRVAARDPRPCRSPLGRALSAGKARRKARDRRARSSPCRTCSARSSTKAPTSRATARSSTGCSTTATR